MVGKLEKDKEVDSWWRIKTSEQVFGSLTFRRWMRTGMQGRKWNASQVPPSLWSSSLPDLLSCSNAALLLPFTTRTCTHMMPEHVSQPLLPDQTTLSHNIGIMRKPVFFLGIFFRHWSAPCYNCSETNKGRQLKESKSMFLQFTLRRRDFHILYMRKNVRFYP